MLADETRYFPGAPAHALTLMDSCESLSEAIVQAAFNFHAAKTLDDADHWLEIVKVLNEGGGNA